MKPTVYCTLIALATGCFVGLSSPTAQAQISQTEATQTELSATPLKPGDRIRLTVAGFPDFSGDQVILSDGTIQLPMAGNVPLGGLTPTRAIARVSEALTPYVRRPQVGLSLLSLSPIRISVSGEVLRPGPRTFTPDVNQNVAGRMTLSDAIGLAGGVTPSADLRNIVIRRAVGAANIQTNSPTPAQSEVKVNLWQAVQTGDLAANPPIYDGDEIVIPKAIIVGAEQQALLESTIAPTRISVQVAGEVQRPGQLEVSPSSGVTAAIAAAGGLTREASRRSIQLLRVTPEGQLERRTIAFGETSAPLRNGDLIVVERSGTSNFLEILGRVLNPLSSIFYLLGR
jgi:polysaccharide export outer membrane protein